MIDINDIKRAFLNNAQDVYNNNGDKTAAGLEKAASTVRAAMNMMGMGSIDDEAYEELKLEVIPEMEKSIKSMVGKTTDGKYNDVIYNNDEGMLVENSVGELVPISKLSMGTIDQMYLGFRMGISKKFGDLPIILDESFAYYDDERLENTLNTLLKLNKQIIIMTCSDREKNILDKLKEKYNYLEV